MCMEDIKLGRTSGSDARLVPITAVGVTEIAPADPKRTRLVVSSDGTQIAFLGSEGFTPAIGSGFTLTVASPVIVIRIEDYGKLVTGRWTAISAAGVPVLTVNTVTQERTQ